MEKMSTKAGLEGVIAGESSICLIDGDAQKLYYRGYNVADLAKFSTFEETIYLLLKGNLPTQSELDAFSAEIKNSLQLPQPVLDLIKSIPADTHPMDVLRTGVSLLSAYDDLDSMAYDEESDFKKALALLAQAPMIVASYHRARKGLAPLEPLADLGIAGNFLYLINGEKPTEEQIKYFDICLILHADHGFNASTFTGRVVAGTYSDMHSAATAAIGALKGPLHGGANQKVKEMLGEINSAGEVADYIAKTLEAGGKIFGFGHRVYRTCEDPRAGILREIARSLAAQSDNPSLFEISQAINEEMVKIAEAKGKPLYPNVDFFSASVYTYLGIEDDLFTPVFAISRMAGWCAHVYEQHANNRLIRPGCEYTGDRDLEYTLMDNR